MIMQLCGPNLNEISEKLPRKKFTYECIQKIAYVAIDILREIHAANLIYRDIKPDNFMTTRDNTHPYILLIDFGLSKELVIDGKKSTDRITSSLTGTSRYMSARAHARWEHGQADDLQALCHMLAYFLLGKLPWQNLAVTEQENRHAKTMAMKNKNGPSLMKNNLAFQKLYNYTLALNFEDKPNYSLMQEIVLDGVAESSLKFDWIKETSTSRHAQLVSHTAKDETVSTRKMRNAVFL